MVELYIMTVTELIIDESGWQDYRVQGGLITHRNGYSSCFAVSVQALLDGTQWLCRRGSWKSEGHEGKWITWPQCVCSLAQCVQ